MTTAPQRSRTNPACELTDVIRISGARRSIGVRLSAGGTWGVRLRQHDAATLHIVLAGELWLGLDDRASARLGPGDLVWLPADTAHSVSAHLGGPTGTCDVAATELALRTGGEMQLGQEPRTTRMMTLHYQADPDVSTPAMLGLSEPMHLSARERPALSGISQLLDAELARPQLGTAAATNSLIDLLLVQLVRAWMEPRGDDVDAAPLGRSLDPVLRDALALIHHQPERDWTTDSLARAIDISRATLARRFTAALGQTPGTYLTVWRMNLAALRLRDTEEPVDAIARAVGYRSPHAFSRAFRRTRGRSPSEYRSHARAQLAAVEG